MNRAVPGLYHAGLKYFGLWKKAIEAAGIDGFQAKQLKKWDKNKIIKGIKKRNKTGSPLNSGAVQQADNNLISAAIRHFGSWKKAIEAAGFDYSKIRKHERKWNREKVIKEIQKIYKHGKPVNCASIKKSHNSLFNAAVRYIGPSWQEAIELAGLDWSEIRKLQEWDRKRIIKAIQLRKKKGKSLYQSDIRKDDYALYLAGWRYFSSWGKALEEAGFDASKARKNKQWSKSKIIQAIKEYHKKGIPLNIVSIKKADPKLLDAAKYHFGSWGKALEEAGFDASEIRKLKNWSKSRNPGTQ